MKFIDMTAICFCW